MLTTFALTESPVIIWRAGRLSRYVQRYDGIGHEARGLRSQDIAGRNTSVYYTEGSSYTETSCDLKYSVATKYINIFNLTNQEVDFEIYFQVPPARADMCLPFTVLFVPQIKHSIFTELYLPLSQIYPSRTDHK